MRCTFLNPHPPEHSSGLSGFSSLQRNRLFRRREASSNIDSTLVLAPIGSTLAKLEGQIIWRGEVVLDVWELVDLL